MSKNSTDESLSNELVAPFLVWSHLTHNCHDKAALTFLKQWQGIDDNHIQAKKKGKKDVNNNELANELLNSPAWLTLEYRKYLRVLIEDGRMIDTIEYLRQHFPHIYDNQCILFRLHCQHFIELVRSDQYDQALEYVAHVLTPAVSKERVLLEPLLSDVVELLAYKDPHTSPVAHLLSQERRNVLSDDINATILSTNLNHSSIFVDEKMSKLEMVVRQAKMVEGECKAIDPKLLETESGILCETVQELLKDI